MTRHRLAAVLALIVAGGSAQAAPLCEDLGFAGLLASCNRGEPIALTLASGQPIHAGTQPVELQSGAYYELEITADGSAELALTGAGFFRSIWINEIVINDIEIRPMAVDSLEFDDQGTARMSFVAIRPGTYDLSIPGSSGESQRVEFVIR
ncbi:hypothetical protein [Rubellimicrobium aerolatum]|uniref:MSP domain-containing protein n=1 Tax=Rubellimicrobium aerolatum TaxID=490979 RepID=A0ABW0SHC0_9RHOB|nr:hypothetical protein [Rubellimicrobium aerolatum]MBP1807740.1 hypothetical protein [Rubellimicrobium aerolatum]